MMWKNEVYRQLRSQHLFENEAHQSRFKELLDCYSQAVFFTPGLCKCIVPFLLGRGTLCYHPGYVESVKTERSYDAF